MHHHYIDRFAYQDSPIHRLDARAKILAVLVYSTVLISLPRYVIPSAWYAVLPFTMLVWAGVPLRFVAKHTLLVSPFVVCLVAFAPVFDRSLVRLHGTWTVAGGWVAAASILVRFVLGMAALIALASTTRFPDLLRGLRRLGVPHILVLQLQFLYRYLFLLLDQAMHIRQARTARDAGKGPLAWRWRGGAGQIGMLLVRTLEQADRTHMAMLARGYDGTIQMVRPGRWRQHDWAFLLATIVYVTVLRWW
ncbi:MAG TPA: cobalt ECF transporter T component CbiQ [Phycisphaerae bacterium]|nr:cobalt ECF transporter T component CbiQ [Phycisphaerae bacterium]HRY68796.1 cobalt ECF transporter T component CbiQ [Phycisphaerae bacterium]HSA27459.1 cobalt ECF transporter T component CbiQ [Phycisphaerae bacterium]